MQVSQIANQKLTIDDVKAVVQLSKLVLASAIRKAVDDANPSNHLQNPVPKTPSPEKTIEVTEELSRHINPAILQHLASNEGINDWEIEAQISKIEPDISPEEVIKAFQHPTENNLSIRQKYRKEFLHSLIETLMEEGLETKNLLEQITLEEQEKNFNSKLADSALYYLALYLTSTPEKLNEDTSLEAQESYSELYKPRIQGVLYKSLDLAQNGIEKEDLDEALNNKAFINYNVL